MNFRKNTQNWDVGIMKDEQLYAHVHDYRTWVKTYELIVTQCIICGKKRIYYYYPKIKPYNIENKKE